MYVVIEENPNCGSDERMFSESGEKRVVNKLNVTPPKTNQSQWCDVVAVDESGTFCPAHAQRVEDSSDGTAWLIFGGSWGLRLRSSENPAEWSLENSNQWGVPFLVLDSSGTSIEFQ